MAADVTSLVRLMNRGDTVEPVGQSTAPITRDLLGGCSTAFDSQELDLDLQVPCGWEKRLDLKSGKVYIQRFDSSNSSNSENKAQPNDPPTKFQDLNFPPTFSKPTLSLFNDSTLNLQLASPLSASPSSSNYQSVCTLDKVKSALERAEKESVRKRSRSTSKSSSPISNSSSLTKDCDLDHDYKLSAPMAAGCPCCLMYVLISKNNPKCPRCNSNVPLPNLAKKPRIDLNMSI